MVCQERCVKRENPQEVVDSWGGSEKGEGRVRAPLEDLVVDLVHEGAQHPAVTPGCEPPVTFSFSDRLPVQSPLTIVAPPPGQVRTAVRPRFLTPSATPWHTSCPLSLLKT